MRILFIIRELEIGGAQRQLCLLANSLASRGHEPVIAVFYSGGKLEADLHDGVRVEFLGKSGRWDVFSFFYRLLKLIAHERAEIVHGYMHGGNLCALLSRIVSPRSKIVWGMRASQFDPKSGDRVSRIVDWIEARLSFLPHRIIVNSVAGMRYCTGRGFPRKSLVHIPNAIDSLRYYIDHEGRKRIRAEWGIAETETLVGLVGRLDPMKGHSVFLTAAAQLNDTSGKLRFVCLGSGSQQYLGDMQNLAKRLGLSDRLLWLDARTDMRAVYNAIDVVCSASVYGEGFPNVIGEAMASGRRCVVTDIGDSEFVVGDTQVVVRHNDPSELASGILRQAALTTGANNAARQRVVDCFSAEKLTDTTESVLRDLLQMNSELVDAPTRGIGPLTKNVTDDATNQA
jgi:glycosyltransferase involved in cell wall biosynthesis